MAAAKPAGLTPKQLELRRTVLGGTDAAAILGVSRYRGAWDVWAEKSGFALPEGELSEDAMWGILLEPVVLAEYQRRTEVTVHKPARLRRHPERPWQAGHLDGLAPDRVVEVKTRGSDSGWGEPGSDEVPPEVKVQGFHYLAVTGRPRLDIAALFRGQRMSIYTLTPEPGLLDELTAEEADWWAAHVVAGEPPPYDGDPRTTAVIRARHPRAARRELIALPAQYPLIEDYRHNLSRAEFYATQAERLKQQLMDAMEDADVLLAPDMRITWANRAGRLSWKQYAESLEKIVDRLAPDGVNLDGVDYDLSTLRELYRGRGDRVWSVTDKRKEIS